MTPRADASGRRADARRNEAAIAEAALRVLAEQPQASMAEIAEASGLGRATLYRHFRNRGELVHAIQRQALDSAGEAIAACGLGEVSPPQALDCAIRALVGVGDRYRVLAREASLDPRMLEQQQAVARPLLATVLRGQESGELRRDLPPPWIIATMANLLVLALREIGAGRLTADEAADMVASTLLRGVAAQA
jgi:AcrR family transcriptional regulator